MEPFILTIFWMIGILWAIYYWYLGYMPTKCVQLNSTNIPKVVFDFNSDKRHSTSSIESLEYSDNEGTRRKNIEKLKHEIKTRWPSRTSIKPRLYKSF